MGVPVEDGRDLSEGTRAPELPDMLCSHKVIRRHTEPTRERCQTVDIGLAALGQTGERRGADARLCRHLLPSEATETPFGVQCSMQCGVVETVRASIH